MFRRYISLATLITASPLLVTGCVGSSGSGQSESLDDFPFTEMLANYTDNIIEPSYRSFAELSQTISVSSYCDAIGSDSESSALDAAQREWLDLMTSWQANEMMIIGPLASSDMSLRNRILSYGSNFSHNACAVDQAVIAATEPDFSIVTRRNSARGLDALEYLLFNQDLDHSCPATTEATQDWNDLTDSERKTQRCAYAKFVSADITQQAQTLLEQWDAQRSDFLNPVNTSESLGALSDALFYIEEYVKDTKAGIPTSIINSGCDDAACPDDVESPYTETSFANIRVNLQTFKTLLTGGSGLGFDDVIARTEFSDSGIIENLLSDTDAAVSFIDSMDQSLLDQAEAQLLSGDETACTNSAANPDSGSVDMCSLYGLLKRITDRLRVDFIAAVNLDLPERSQSDND